MSAFVSRLTPRAGQILLRSPRLWGTPASMAAWDMKVIEFDAGAAPWPPNMVRMSVGSGVGIEALASPMTAEAIWPPLRIKDGLTPKKAGSHSTRSAHLPTSTLPTTSAIPLVRAGLIVYFDT